MRKAIAVLFIFIMMLSPLAFLTPARAAEIEYFSFEGFRIVSINVGTSVSPDAINTVYLIGSAIVAHDPYLGQVVVEGTVVTDPGAADETNQAWIVVKSNSGETAQSDPIQLPGTAGTTFKIKKSVGMGGNSFQVDFYFEPIGSASWTISFDKAYFYFINDPVQGINSELTSYTPVQGVVGEALRLDRVELYMTQHVLSTGTIKFAVKWDGSNVTILDNVWIDGTGHVNIKDANGTIFTSNATVKLNDWSTVVIAFQSGTLSGGYISIDSNVTEIPWSGEIQITKIGDVAQSTNTLIDELYIYDTYFSPSEAIGGVERYYLIQNTTAIPISPEGGEKLGNITATFLDAGFNTIASNMFTPTNTKISVPSGAEYVLLTRGNVQRIYKLDTIQQLAFPAEGATVTSTQIIVRPTQWQYVTVKTLDGRIATRVALQNNEAGFTALYGNQYLFVFERGNETRVRTYTVTTNSIVFYILDTDMQFKPPIDVKAYVENGTIVVQYYDANLETTSLDVTVIGYKDYGKVWEIHDYQAKQFGLYTLKTDSNNTEYAEIVIKADVSGQIQEFKRTVYVEGATTRSSFPQELIPPALLVLGFALVPMFLFRAIEVHMMLLGGAIGLSIGALLGWIPAMPALITILTVLGIVAMIVYRRG